MVTPGADIAARTTWTQELLTDPKTKRAYQKRIIELLALADLGVTGIDFDPASGALRLQHRTPKGEDTALDFLTEESFGTHAWFAFLGPMLTVLDKGATLLVDELDSSLHPALAAEVVRLFQDPRSNPRNAQLIFTTHDATLLGSAVLDRPLGRDQVWIAAKASPARPRSTLFWRRTRPRTRTWSAAICAAGTAGCRALLRARSPAHCPGRIRGHACDPARRPSPRRAGRRRRPPSADL
ncbi:ATP-binding protein [Streptomyces sp. 21So2-11]|uniref:AAA family ATPase n=1 Tax=Streptomyces sp. 21So2-11 TaxID=3144408 RepID=UPI00321B646E